MNQYLQIFGALAGLFVLVSNVPYIRSVLAGKTKPERAAVTIWMSTSAIGFFAYWAQGAQESLWFAASDVVIAVVMFLLAIKHGYGWVKKRDSLAIVIAISAIVAWIVTNDPFTALVFSALADAIGYILVAIKSYEAPESEHLVSWLIYSVGAWFAVLAVGSLDFKLLFYPTYVALSSGTVVVAITAGRLRASRRAKL